MPKINVYLPDDLAAAVKAADLPVSAICQKALSDAVRTIGTARKGIKALQDSEFDPDSRPQFAARLVERMTPRLREALALAHAATAGPQVRTADLLIGILDQRDNLAIRLLQTLEHDLDELREAAQQIEVDEALPSVSTSAPASADDDGEPSMWSGMTLPSRIAIGAALEASIDLGHNYFGCEHLLLGLLADPRSGAGRVLTGVGLDSSAVRRAIAAAVAGFAQARQTSPHADSSTLDRLIGRLDSIDRRLDAAGI
jgi:ATP-dependent Clp protease ATP-binding subunit ClpA